MTIIDKIVKGVYEIDEITFTKTKVDKNYQKELMKVKESFVGTMIEIEKELNRLEEQYKQQKLELEQNREEARDEKLHQFKLDLAEYFGVSENPKHELLFQKAWRLGHIGGLHEVYLHYSTLVDLIR